MTPSMESTRPSVRRSRWRLWVSLGVFVLLAIAAIPAWRYYWHAEYQRHLHTISRNSRDSYHEPPPWSVLTSLPRSLRPMVSRLRTVDITSDLTQSVTAADLRRLNQIVRYRQFGLGVERLCLTYVPLDAWDGLDGYKDLLSLQLRFCELPADCGDRLRRMSDLNVLIVVGDLENFVVPQLMTVKPPDTPEAAAQRLQRVEEARKRHRDAISSLCRASQLEELVLGSHGPLLLAGNDLRTLSELHRLSLQTRLSPDELIQLADLPALRLLDLSGLVPDGQSVRQGNPVVWRDEIADFQRRRPDVDVVPPGYLTWDELGRWKKQADLRRMKSAGGESGRANPIE